MTDVVLERTVDPPTDPETFLASTVDAAGCFDLYRVTWLQSMLSRDGKRLICWFRGVDTESVRVALRMNGVDTRVLWRASYHEAPRLEPDALATVNVIVERRFSEPVTLEAIQAIEDAGAGCLRMRDVDFVCTLFSADQMRMVCLYRAPDAESVREAQREAGMPFEAIWGVDVILPDAAGSGK